MSKVSDLINDLSSGEDEFDVDLMAAGCRVRPTAPDLNTMSPDQLVALYGFDVEELTATLNVLVADGTVSTKEVFRAAEKVASGRAA